MPGARFNGRGGYCRTTVVASSAFPLSIASGSRYLISNTGSPFRLHGYVCWSAIVALSRSNATTLLNAMQSCGINAIICNAIEKHWTPSPPNNANGDAPFTSTLGGGSLDFTSPNSTYWSHVDWFLSECDKRGIVVFLFPSYYGFIGASPAEGWSAEMSDNGSSRLTTYGAFLGTRYAGYRNIVWCHFGDALPDATGRALVKNIQDGIKSTDVAGRLHTNHYARGSLSTDDTTVPSDIIWAYSGGGSVSPRVHKKVLDGYAVGGPKPTFLGEAEYDHRATGALTAQQLRCQNWDAWFSGGCGNFFGAENWYNHLNDTAINQYGFVRLFLATRQWQLLVPSQGVGLVTSGGGTEDTDGYKPRAIASDSSWGVVYCTDGTTVTVNLALFSGTITARWFDPTDGSYYAVTGGPTFANSGTHAFVASSEHGNNSAGGTDLVLVLETAP